MPHGQVTYWTQSQNQWTPLKQNENNLFFYVKTEQPQKNDGYKFLWRFTQETHFQRFFFRTTNRISAGSFLSLLDFFK